VLLLGGLFEPLGVLGKRGWDVVGSGPEIRGKESVGVADGNEAGLNEVLGGTGATGWAGEDIIDTSELQDLLWDGGSDETGTTGGGDQTEADGTTLTGGLHGDGMHVTDLVTPVTSTDGDKSELSANEGTLDGNLDFLGELDAETDVTVVVTDNDDSLEAGTLTGLGLLLDRHDLHDLVGKGTLSLLDELVNNGGLFDWDGVSVDLLEVADVTVLNESTKLGSGGPVVLAGATGATTTTTTATAATATTTASAFAEATAAFAATLLSSGSLLSLSFHL
jgi:hypothetical protein